MKLTLKRINPVTRRLPRKCLLKRILMAEIEPSGNVSFDLWYFSSDETRFHDGYTHYAMMPKRIK